MRATWLILALLAQSLVPEMVYSSVSIRTISSSIMDCRCHEVLLGVEMSSLEKLSVQARIDSFGCIEFV